MSAATIPSTSDEFSSSKLGLQWQWHANHRDDWFSLTARTGWLRLYAQKCGSDDLNQCSNLLLQKFPAREFTVEVSLDFSGGRPGDEAGLIIMGRAHAGIALRKTEFGALLVFRNGEVRTIDETSSNTAFLRVTVREGGVCSFSHAGKNGEWIALPQTFQAQPGVWIGAKVGVYCVSRNGGAGGGFADFDHFRFVR